MTFTLRRPELRSPARYADYGLGLSAIVVALVGVVLNYSATWRLLEFNGENPAAIAGRQLIFVLLGAIVMVVVSVVDYRVLLAHSATIYLVAMVALAGVLFLGVERRGARSWYEIPRLEVQIQPSEFVKLAVIVALAAFFGDQRAQLAAQHAGKRLVVSRRSAGADVPAARPRHDAGLYLHSDGDAAAGQRSSTPHRYHHAAGAAGGRHGVQH